MNPRMWSETGQPSGQAGQPFQPSVLTQAAGGRLGVKSPRWARVLTCWTELGLLTGSSGHLFGLSSGNRDITAALSSGSQNPGRVPLLLSAPQPLQGLLLPPFYR